MGWNDSLNKEQEEAASYYGSHIRMLAGPGTGKTFVICRKIVYLIKEKKIHPNEIVALTFTRAAAREMANRIAKELGTDQIPRISTLHSFALKQLLFNGTRIVTLPQPLRIADDWEERNIIQEDLKWLLGYKKIKRVKDDLIELASDWDDLRSENGVQYPNPKFLGAWDEHRIVFGYTLRAELVYQLKNCIQTLRSFNFDKPIRYIIVDEFQDLNKCDLNVIDGIINKGAEAFIAGDDDQSIYGFRKAFPNGIRDFNKNYPNVKELTLTKCKRCGNNILSFAEFIANQDTHRIKKKTIAEPEVEPGSINIYNFIDEYHEAEGLANKCKEFIDSGINPGDILILLRSDKDNAFSEIIKEKFLGKGIPISTKSLANSPIDLEQGRLIISFIRLLQNQHDHLSWRTIFKLHKKNRVGEKTIRRIYDIARNNGRTFFEVIDDIHKGKISIEKSIENKIKYEIDEINKILDELKKIVTTKPTNQDFVANIIDFFNFDSKITIALKEFFSGLCNNKEIENISDLLRNLESTNDYIEQEIDKNSINILTMHKAKGLTSEIVIIPAVEDEFIPGRNYKEPNLGDERRLFFVSITRTKKILILSYCDKRIGRQKNHGRFPGKEGRTPSRFIRNSPIPIIFSK